NAKVADVLNHIRNVSKKASEQADKLKDKLNELIKQKLEKESNGKNTDTIDKRIESVKDNIENKTNTMQIAITTSLTNYIDPRIIVSWSKKINIPIDYIYT